MSQDVHRNNQPWPKEANEPNTTVRRLVEADFRKEVLATAKILRYRNAGLTLREIAKLTGYDHPQQIQNILRRRWLVKLISDCNGAKK